MMSFQTSIRNIFSWLLFLGCLAVSLSERKRYDGYQMIRALPTSAQHLQVLQNHYDVTDCCKEPRAVHTPVDILVHPDHITSLNDDMAKHAIKMDVTMDDIQSVIDSQENIKNSANPKLKRKRRKFNFKQYHRQATIYKHINKLAKKYSTIMKKEVVGKTVEGRSMLLITLSKDGPKDKSIWVDGGIHAREWISPAVVMYLLTSILKDQSLLDTHDVYLMPLANPDGYEYSHTDERFWRKNRATNNGGRCRGVDLNRNFDAHFGLEGTSSNPCSEVFKGPSAFSEPETSAMRDAIRARAENMELFLTVHSYSQMILVPYGYQSYPVPYAENFESMKRVARNGTAAMKSLYDVPFIAGNTAELLGGAAGGTDDWVKKAVGVNYVYTVELRDNGKHGFLLPEDQIKPSGREMWEGLKAMVKAIAKEKKDEQL